MELLQVSSIKDKLLELEGYFPEFKRDHDYLLNGETGMALYYFYLGRLLDEPVFTARALQLTDAVIDNVHTPGRFYGGAFSLGITGLASALWVMKGEGFIDFEEEELAALDEGIFSWAQFQVQIHNTDYLHGAAGALYYFILRNKAELAAVLMKAIFSGAVEDENGIRLFNRFEHNPRPEDINLSLSHGLSGLLLILIEAFHKGIEPAWCREIISKGLQYIEHLHQRFPVINGISEYPVAYTDATDTIHGSERLAWCYGDLNIILLMYRASPVLEDPSLIEKATALGKLACTRRAEQNTKIVTPFYCHGSSGTASFFEALYNISGERCYQEAYTYWKDVTIRMFTTDNVRTMSDGPFSMLDGPIGAAYFLMDVAAGKRMLWNKLFLL
ncbi:lanthionine synthetase LanC family protein [Chitinophaga sp.]|uniref:lanthionine synthetase LanC family protein n=1 Tax=Chitinophaga sp. TaxID=1869181 RepID=UPI0031DB0DBF